MESDARVGILQGVDVKLHRHAFKLLEAIRHRTQGELADRIILGEGNEAGGRILAQHLLVSEDRGDTGVEMPLSVLRQSQYARSQRGLLKINKTAGSLEALYGGVGAE